MRIIKLPSDDPRVIRVRFNGVIYRRYPNAKSFADRNYFRAGVADRKKGYDSLHRDMWKLLVGPIPAGYHIHHRDSNPLNNAIDNFECLSVADHHERHIPTPRQKSAISWKKKRREMAAVMNEKAKEWHKSPEGHAWHVAHGKAIFGNLKPIELVCQYCSKPYQTKKHSRNHYCSNKCRSYARKRDKKDHEERTCAQCGATFDVDRYTKIKYCSRKCSGLAQRTRQERTCLWCQATFVIYRASPRKCCSRPCGYALRSATIAQGKQKAC